MLRRKYLAGNLKRERDRTIARYCQSFLSNVRNAQGRISRQNDSKDEDNATNEKAVISETSWREVTEKRSKEAIKLQDLENTVAIKLTNLDRPGTSGSPQFTRKEIAKSDRNKGKKVQAKATQMRQSLSAQRLQADYVDDDFSSAEETNRRQQYVLVGWDDFRSKLMISLLVLLILWAVIYFPLIGT